MATLYLQGVGTIRLGKSAGLLTTRSHHLLVRSPASQIAVRKEPEASAPGVAPADVPFEGARPPAGDGPHATTRAAPFAYDSDLSAAWAGDSGS